MLKPFHLSFAVADLTKAKHFYLEVLGCDLGRDNEFWFDVLFFGHQLTIHLAESGKPGYSMDHFGPVLGKEQWQQLAYLIAAKGIEFHRKPKVLNLGLENESGKFLLKDPDGNIIEFKYYVDFVATVS